MSSTQQILARAVERHRNGDGAGAASLYRLVLALDPAQRDGLHLLGLLTRRAGRMDEGVVLMGRALRGDPFLPDAQFNRGAALLEHGDLDEAAAHFRRRLALEPACDTALFLLGTDALALGRIEDAERRLRHAAAMEASGDSRNGPRIRRALERCATMRAVRDEAADPSLPPGLVVRGVFRDSSGYAYKVRQFVRHLVTAGIRVRLLDLNYEDTDNLSEGQIDPMLLALDQPVRAKAVLSFTTPPVVEAVPGLKTINYTVFEAADIPPLWAAHSRRHDHVVVATESSREAWLSAGHPGDRVHICPEGVEAVADGTAPLAVVDPAGRRLSDHRVRILNVSDSNTRKNLIGLLRVWLTATRAEDDAALILKIGKGNGSRSWVQSVIAQASAATGRPLAMAAPVFLLEGMLSDADMTSLCVSSTHYWSMSHGEGWDLPMAQAGAVGLTLMAPDHSAYRAYLDDRVAHMIPSRVTPAFDGYRGRDWWTPDEDAASRLLRAVIDDPEGTRRSARRHLLDHFSWEAATRRLIALLKELDAL